MLASRVESAALRASVIFTMLVLFYSPVHGATLTVKRDGTGDFTTIQACADAASEGDTCVVYAGCVQRTCQNVGWWYWR